MKNRKLKKIVVATSMLSVMSVNMYAFGLGDITGAVSSVVAPQSSSNQGKCPSRNSGKDMLKQQMTNQILTPILDNLTGLKNLEIPKKLNNTCQADKGLKLVKKSIKNVYDDIADTTKLLAKSLLSKEAESNMLAKIDRVKGEMNLAKKAEDMSLIIEQLLKTAQDHGAQDSDAYYKAVYKLTMIGTSRLGSIIGQFKELIEFGGDNTVWTVKHIKDIPLLYKPIKIIIDIAKVVPKFTKVASYEGRVPDEAFEKNVNQTEEQEKADIGNGFGDEE